MSRFDELTKRTQFLFDVSQSDPVFAVLTFADYIHLLDEVGHRPGEEHDAPSVDELMLERTRQATAIEKNTNESPGDNDKSRD